MSCVAQTAAPLITAVEEWSLNCPACHIDATDVMDPVYLTAFFPGDGKRQYEFPLCGSCAVEVRNRAMQGADKLESREFGGQDPGPQTQSSSFMQGAGLFPPQQS